MEIYFKNRKEWHKWLEKYHNIKGHIWLICYKKISGRISIPYDDAVEEAICYGLIALKDRIHDQGGLKK
jgi:uncharacterized protein YdeI (YjbR/CyaY-like superfamily)